MAKPLIIVESPAKARTISRYLGNDFDVESSIGHVRDLPSAAAEIPAKYKAKGWARLGVDVDEGFKPLYIVPPGKKTQVAKLRKKVKDAPELYLATDEDREGEAIAWHLVEVLHPDCPVRRMVFHEITHDAIRRALEATRGIDQDLVNAQEARRILDRLVGYEVSPVLWRKVRPKLSAGRVQSVATRLVVAREEARIRFRQASYAGVEARLHSERDPATPFTARLSELNGRRVATGKDFDDTTGELKDEGLVHLETERARRIASALEGSKLRVAEVKEKPFTTRPYPPFMTSTLQQEAGRKLRFNAQRTMRVAQNLYENGFITYMRTDSTSLSREAVDAARSQVRQLYGDAYLPEKPRVFARTSRTAQEAHEAIRPAGSSFRTPESLRGVLAGDELRLYELIWKRTLACQMRDATGRRSTVRVEGPTDDGVAVLTASGKVLTFAGFLRTYVEGSDDPEAELADQESLLPTLEQGQPVDADEVRPTEHTTQPPQRYTEASLVRELESRGIGRPSTYATIIQTIQDRGYVWHKGPALVPTFTAFAVVKLLERYLPDLVDYDFTARMEDELDTIARGERDMEPWLHDFYFGGNGERRGNGSVTSAGLKSLVESTIDRLGAREASRILLGETDDGDEIAVRIGRYGAYVQVGDGDRRASVPDDMPPDELTSSKALELVERSARQDEPLGHDPETGEPVFVKEGRYGPYVQLGEGGGDRAKPKMASLWPSMSPDSVTLDQALMLLKEFPREVGRHPETDVPITAQDGRFGPYLKMGDETRSLDRHEQLRDIDLDGAVELFRQPKQGRRSGRPATLGELGQHPATGASVQVKSGRFGPYVTDGEVNASLPKGADPDAVTLERAVELLAARRDKLAAQGKTPGAKGGAKKRTTTKKKPGTRKKSAGKKTS